MVIKCLATGCSAKKYRNKTKTSVQFHRFPLRKPDVLAKWVKAMNNPNFKPTVKSYLCSAHFAASDYEVRPNKTGKHLKSNAVPTIFAPFAASDYEVRPNKTGKHLKSNGVPTIFEKRRPGRKKKILSENEITEETKENVEESVIKNENYEIVEEEYLETNTSDKEESNLAEIIGNQEKETLQILIVGEDGKITKSKYMLKKEFFSQFKTVLPNGEEVREQESDGTENRSKKKINKSYGETKNSDISLFNNKKPKKQEKIKQLEMNLVSTKQKVSTLQLKCKKMNRKLNRLKILLKLLVLKRGKGEKNLKQLLEEYEKELEDFKMKVKEEVSDF